MAKKYQKYSKEFKEEAVRLAATSDKSVCQTARELGIRQNQIYKWRKEIEGKGEVAFPGRGKTAEVDPEKAQLRKDLATAQEEIEILKKAAAYFARDIR